MNNLDLSEAFEMGSFKKGGKWFMAGEYLLQWVWRTVALITVRFMASNSSAPKLHNRFLWLELCQDNAGTWRLSLHFHE